jgi:hypothetical protein
VNMYEYLWTTVEEDWRFGQTPMSDTLRSDVPYSMRGDGAHELSAVDDAGLDRARAQRGEEGAPRTPLAPRMDRIAGRVSIRPWLLTPRF